MAQVQAEAGSAQLPLRPRPKPAFRKGAPQATRGQPRQSGRFLLLDFREDKYSVLGSNRGGFLPSWSPETVKQLKCLLTLTSGHRARC